MKCVSDSLKVIDSLNLLGEVSGGLLGGLLGIETLANHFLDLIEFGDAFLMDSGHGGYEQIVVVDCDDLGNLSDLVVKHPSCDLLGL